MEVPQEAVRQAEERMSYPQDRPSKWVVLTGKPSKKQTPHSAGNTKTSRSCESRANDWASFSSVVIAGDFNAFAPVC